MTVILTVVVPREFDLKNTPPTYLRALTQGFSLKESNFKSRLGNEGLEG